MPKACDKCGDSFTGFGGTCSRCRKGNSRGSGSPRGCSRCGVFFTGYNAKCDTCAEATTAEDVEEQEGAESAGQAAVRASEGTVEVILEADIVCSVCNHRVVESEVAFGQGKGNVGANREEVDIVVCTSCSASTRTFTRRPPSESERLLSPRRLEVDRERTVWKEALAKASVAEEAASARALAAEEAKRAGEEEIARLRAEIERMKKQPSDNTSAERR